MKNYNRLNILIILLLLFSNITLSAPNEYNAIYVFSKSGIEFAESKHEMVFDELNQWCLYTRASTYFLSKTCARRIAVLKVTYQKIQTTKILVNIL